MAYDPDPFLGELPDPTELTEAEWLELRAQVMESDFPGVNLPILDAADHFRKILMEPSNGN